jgi:hypothetical protein
MPVYLDFEPIKGTAQEAFWAACSDPDLEKRPQFPALIGAPGVGKTHCGAVATIANALNYPAPYLVLAPTYRNHMLMATLPKYKEFLVALHTQSLREYKKPLIVLTADGKVYHETKQQIELTTGATLHFRSTDEPEKLYGGTMGGIHADEAALMPEMVVAILPPRLRAPDTPQQAILTFTPKGSSKHWTNRWYGRQVAEAKEALARGEPGIGADRDYPVFGLNMEDNPALSRRMIARLKEEAEKNPFARQEYYWDWIEVGGLIFAMFDASIHVRDKRQDTVFTRYAAGIDFGMSSPTVIEVAAEDQHGRRWFTGEFSKPFCSGDDLLRACYNTMEEYPGIRFACDPHDPAKIQWLRRNMVPAYKADPSVNSRITLIWDYLAVRGDGLPGLFYTPDCVNLIAEAESWSWRAGASPGGQVTYDDVEPHAHHSDAAGYAMVALGRTFQPMKVIWGAREEVAV